MVRYLTGLLVCVTSSAAGGCSLFSATDDAGEIVFVVLPAYPRDEALIEVSVERFSADVLEKPVIEWHAAADWTEVEKTVRAAAEQRQGVLASLWKGQVLRVAGQKRTHQCWYMVVLLGSTTRVLDGPPRSITTVHSLGYGSRAGFLETVLDGMDVFERRMRERPTMTASAL